MNTRWTSLATANLQHDVCDPIVFSCTTPYNEMDKIACYLQNFGECQQIHSSGAMSKMLL